MPPPSMETKVCSGHGSFPPTTIIKGSPDCFTNDLANARVGDSAGTHPSPSPSPPHPRTLSSGSDNIFINDKPAVRIGDQVDCGGHVMQGAKDVIFN